MHTEYADIVVSAIGKPKLLGIEYFMPGQLIIDVGINRDEDGKLCGDINPEDLIAMGTYVTPVPRGVGLLTRLALLENVVSAYYKRRKYNEKRI